jgi:hypothetical protein
VRQSHTAAVPHARTILFPFPLRFHLSDDSTGPSVEGLLCILRPGPFQQQHPARQQQTPQCNSLNPLIPMQFGPNLDQSKPPRPKARSKQQPPQGEGVYAEAHTITPAAGIRT